jgi:hypothetical protein
MKVKGVFFRGNLGWGLVSLEEGCFEVDGKN